MTQYLRVDLRPPGQEPVRKLSPRQVHVALLEAIEPGAGGHCVSDRDPAADPDGPYQYGVYVCYHARLDVCIVVDDRTPEERARDE